jgi:DNA-binding transcriptional ArsR family regulator
MKLESVERLIEQTERSLAEAIGRREAVDGEIRQIRAALRVLRSKQAAKPPKARRAPKRKARAPHIQAGPAAMQAVTDLLRDGPMTQKQIVEATGLNEGTVSYALKALREADAVEETGRKVDGSRELRFVRGRVGVARALYDRAREVTASSGRVRA